MLEKNKIYNMDCLEGMRNLPNKSIDLVLTDIPYAEVNRESNGLRNLDKEDADVLTFDLNNALKECLRICKGSIYIFCGVEQVSIIYRFLNENGLSTRLLIWKKSNPSPMNGEHVWLSGSECCVFGKFKGAIFNGFCEHNVLEFQSKQGEFNERFNHPTVKPIRLFRKLIEVSSNAGDVVLDFCMGSGTTAVACKQLSRKFIGFEVNEEYCKVAEKRLEQGNLSSWFN